MRGKFEFISGIVLILASLASLLMIKNQSIGGCFVVGGSVLGYIVAYSIAAVLAILGIIYLIQSRR
jgi:hypothetical protein